jgi:hypothetical protein
MSCKYNNCKICGYKSECEIYKENAELKEKLGNYQKGIFDEIEKRDINLTKAKELLKEWLQTSKASGCDNINIVTDTEQFLKELE